MKRIIFLVILLFIAAKARPQSVEVYSQIPSEIVKAEASSTFDGSSPADVVNGAGMQGRYHAANNLGQGMWVSKPVTKQVRANSSTRKGAVWFMCEIGDAPRQIDLIQIWNHNQNEHTRRGFNKLYIEYSEDGKAWKLLPDGDRDHHIIPESVGRNPEPADFTLPTPGLRARYICFTADYKDGNHYDMSDPVTAREAADRSQNPKIYGLSEIRFYTLEKQPAESLETVSGIYVFPTQGYLKTTNGPSREFRVLFNTPVYAGARLTFDMDGESWESTVASDANGVDHFEGLFPAGYMDSEKTLTVRVESPQGNTSRTFRIPAARKWTVSFLPHSHLDIGYTHRQDDVMKLQWRNMERAMELAERTRDYPDGARYCWNTEATWPLAGYLEEYRGTEKYDKIIEAIKDGTINVDATLGSILTGISRQEELMHYFDDAHRIEDLTGVGINTAMMSDVPGQVWGLSTAMALNGVRYYSPGPNYVPFYGKMGNDRAAAIHVKWGDEPFWWQSQSGKDKVMVWSAGRGYSWFHGWLAGRLSVCGTDPIWQYLGELETDEFPYDMCYLRYTVHGDNGPPDELMPDVILQWNEKYDSPHFEITTTRSFFERFEEKFGDYLPTYGGDMTPTWEDGAASTARETAMNRESAARLAQTETLWSMLAPEAGYPREEFEEAWKNVILFSEHTWGASASGPQPHSQFTKDLWAKKKSYADNADAQSRKLFGQAVGSADTGGSYLHVINTNLWPRTDAVTVENIDLTGKQLRTTDGQAVPVQKLNGGSWVFIAGNVPPMSSAVYRIEDAIQESAESMVVDNNTLDNGIVRVTIDPAKGTIASLTISGDTGDTYNYAAGNGLNEYMYSDRLNTVVEGITGVKSIETVDDGPLAATLRIISDAPGANSLQCDVTLYKGIPKVFITNTVDKKDILTHENVRFIFPFNIPHPEVTMDLAISEIHPEREQLTGVNKNYYSLQNGIAVSDMERGVCLTTVDAPFVELGDPTALDFLIKNNGRGWLPSAQISPVIYSWVMNNTWRTNYKASQGGIAVFRYTVEPCDPFDLKLKQRGAEQEQKMIAVTNDDPKPIPELFSLTGRHRIAVSAIYPSADGTGYIVKLNNMGNRTVNSGFDWGSITPTGVSRCDYREEPLEPFDHRSFWMQPYEYIMLKIVTK